MKRYLPLLCCTLLLALAGCGGDQAEPGGATSEAKKSQNVEPVGFRTLRDLLPHETAGLERANLTGTEESAMGVAVSHAEATYHAGDSTSLEIRITDADGLSFAALGFEWTGQEVDRESSSGYERTTQYQGYKAYETYDANQRRGELQVLVSDRFMVKIEGRNVEMETVKAAIDQLDLGALERMKEEGVKTG